MANAVSIFRNTPDRPEFRNRHIYAAIREGDEQIFLREARFVEVPGMTFQRRWQTTAWFAYNGMFQIQRSALVWTDRLDTLTLRDAGLGRNVTLYELAPGHVFEDGRSVYQFGMNGERTGIRVRLPDINPQMDREDRPRVYTTSTFTGPSEDFVNRTKRAEILAVTNPNVPRPETRRGSL